MERFLFLLILSAQLVVTPTIVYGEPAVEALPDLETWVAEQRARDFSRVGLAERRSVLDELRTHLRAANTAAEADPLLDLVDRVVSEELHPVVTRQVVQLRARMIGKLLPNRMRRTSAHIHTRLCVLLHRQGQTALTLPWMVEMWESESRMTRAVESLTAFAATADESVSAFLRAAAESSDVRVSAVAGRWLAQHGDLSIFGEPVPDAYGHHFVLQAPTSHWVAAWTNMRACDLAVYWPTNGPRAQLMVTFKDWDNLWYQHLQPGYLLAGQTNLVHLDLTPDASGWEPQGHTAGWHYRALVEPLEFSIRILHREPFAGQARIVQMTPVPYGVKRAAPAIGNVQPSADRVACHERLEIAFDLPDRYVNPFDSEAIDAYAIITGPDKTAVRVDAFYGRDYHRSVDTAGETTQPHGLPRWYLRYAAPVPGTYTCVLHARDPYGEAPTRTVTFEALPSDHPGYVQVSKRDPRFFEYRNGEPFFVLGHNIRSPFDTRMVRNFPWKARRPEGSLAYRRFFRAMGQHGENFAEVWMAAWSLGLEWSPGWPGYHGIGQYNLRHAWELDQVLGEAEANGILLNLVIHNHGKYSGYSDEEWEFNPFNVARGGYLEQPDDFFTDARAFADYAQLMRYIVARWGYSPNIFAWQLWSELDLTGARRSEPRPQRNPDVVEWHRRAIEMITRLDPNGHLITTHVSGDFKTQGAELIRLPGLSHCSVDAYHQDPDPLRIVSLMNATADYNNEVGKPVLITEFGGSPMASDMRHLDATLDAALWASVAVPLGGAPAFWWWMAIEEENFYPKFAALERFMDGVDRRDPSFTRTVPGLLVSGGPTEALDAECMSNDRMALGWIYSRTAFLETDPGGEKQMRNVSIKIPGLSAGRFLTEFWDTQSGRVVGTASVFVRRDILDLQVPAFARDIAFKVYAEN